jgi:serine phosphatase RsbU (regulator of sigma subunit)
MKRSIFVVFGKLGRFLTRRIILVFGLLFCAAVVGALWNMASLSNNLIQAQALENAHLYADSIAKSRNLYSSDVVNRLTEIDGVTITHDYQNRKGAVPLPATYLIQLSHILSSETSGLTVKLYSDYPFPWRRETGGAKDDFERAALSQLRQHPDQPFFRVEPVQGRPSLRFAQADIMKPSCVGCHDTHPDSPKRDWKVGDVRGVLEVIQPLDSFEAQTRHGLKGTFITMSGLSVVGLAGLAIAINQLQQYSKNLERRVKERTTELAEANEEILELNQRLNHENTRMSAELSVARQLQRIILPEEHELLAIDGLDIAGFMQPAEEVGGDYYDVLRSDNGAVKIGIGDVSGHGLESGILMLMVQTAVRTLFESKQTDWRQLFSVLNRTIYKNVRRMNSNKSLTLTLLDYQDGQLRLSGQHEDPILIHPDGSREHLNTLDLGFPLGMEPDIEAYVDETIVQLQPGDVVILYTDGITEACDPYRHQYGVDRLSEVASQNRHRSSQEICQAVIDDVWQHVGNCQVYDDMTLLILKQK